MNMMQKSLIIFCLKIAFFVLLIFFIDRAIGVCMISIKDCGLRKNPENMWLKTPFVVEKVAADIIVIGSSKASLNYVPQMMMDSGWGSTYNCGQDGCFFLYQNCIINMVLDRYHPKMIIWDIQPESFNKEIPVEEYQNIRYLSPYYPESKWARSYIDGESSKMKYRMKSRMFAYNSKALNYIFPIFTSGDKTDFGYIPLPNDGYKYPSANKKVEESDFEINLNRLSLLDVTIKRCVAAGVDLRLFISPVYGDKSDATLSAIMCIEDVVSKNGLALQNYISDAYFMSDSTLFKDAVHLNDKGARVYTAKILSE